MDISLPNATPHIKAYNANRLKQHKYIKDEKYEH